jgi:hypothetical protein
MEFLTEEFMSMIQKGQWTILPFSAIKNFINLQILWELCPSMTDDLGGLLITHSMG